MYTPWICWTSPVGVGVSVFSIEGGETSFWAVFVEAVLLLTSAKPITPDRSVTINRANASFPNGPLYHGLDSSISFVGEMVTLSWYKDKQHMKLKGNIQ